MKIQQSFDNCSPEYINSRFDHMDRKFEELFELLSKIQHKDSMTIYMNVKQTHELLQVSRRTLYRWIEKGTIKPVQMPGSKSFLFSKQEILNKLNNK